MDEIRVLEKIKALPQTGETLPDAFELVRQIEDKQQAVEWNKWVRSEAKKLRSAAMLELIRKSYLLGAQLGQFRKSHMGQVRGFSEGERCIHQQRQSH